MLAESWGPWGGAGSGAGGLGGWTVPEGLARSPEGGRRSLPELLRPGEPSPAARWGREGWEAERGRPRGPSRRPPPPGGGPSRDTWERPARDRLAWRVRAGGAGRREVDAHGPWASRGPARTGTSGEAGEPAERRAERARRVAGESGERGKEPRWWVRAMATLEVTAAACRGACTSGSHSTGFPLSRAPVPGARPRTPRAMSRSCCTRCCSMRPPPPPGLGSERFRCSTEFFLPGRPERGVNTGKGSGMKDGRRECEGQVRGWAQAGRSDRSGPSACRRRWGPRTRGRRAQGMGPGGNASSGRRWVPIDEDREPEWKGLLGHSLALGWARV